MYEIEKESILFYTRVDIINFNEKFLTNYEIQSKPFSCCKSKLKKLKIYA